MARSAGNRPAEIFGYVLDDQSEAASPRASGTGAHS